MKTLLQRVLLLVARFFDKTKGAMTEPNTCDGRILWNIAVADKAEMVLLLLMKRLLL